MKKERMINKIKKYKISKYKSLFLAGAIGVLPSLFREQKPLSYKLPNEVTAEIVLFGGDTILAKDFYEKIKYSSKVQSWYYPDKNGTNYNVAYLFNYKAINDVTMKKLKAMELKNFEDTTIITYKNKYTYLEPKALSKEFSFDTFEKLMNYTSNDASFFDFSTSQKKEQQTENKIVPPVVRVLYNLNNQSESLGAKAFYQSYRNSITMIELKADPNLPKEEREKLQTLLDSRYNREDILFNYDHEFHHHENAGKGINQLGMSIEQMYLRKCHDELSANLRQFWKQRDAYLKNNKDISKLPSRALFYHDLVTKGKIHPIYGEEISKEEQKYITEGMQEVWDKQLKPIYGTSHISHAKSLVKLNPAYKTAEGTKEYHRVLSEIYKYEVNGQKIDLYPFVKEFTIPFKDKLVLNELKRERGFIENDAISYIREKQGKKAMNEYIADQKMKYAKKSKDR